MGPWAGRWWEKRSTGSFRYEEYCFVFFYKRSKIRACDELKSLFVLKCAKKQHTTYENITSQFNILYTEYNASMVLYLCGLDERV